MKSFLQQTAQHYFGSPEKLSRTVFVFPNHRSALHFRHEMGALRMASGMENLLRLKTVSINDFFQKVYGVETTDRIRLILSLYASYRELNAQAEPLDHFIHWGRVMLSDFDNLDKYLVDAGKIFVNVNDFRSIQDTYQYLTEGQRAAIEHFLSHFRDRGGRLTVNMEADSEKIKGRFLRIWNLLGPLYRSFNERLDAEGAAYEGKIYRACADRIRGGAPVESLLEGKFPGRDRFVFVGLNALCECEKTMLRALLDAGKAEFVWDFSSRELKDARNKASFFLRKNIEEFPQAFPIDADQVLRKPRVRVISVPSSVGQTKLAPGILAEVAGDRPEQTAFILPDEGLLLPLLSSVPESYDAVNITMGYPMEKSAVYSLMKAVGILQLSLRVKDGERYYAYKCVQNIFSNGLFRALLGDEDKAAVERVRKDAKQYIPVSGLLGSEVMSAFFTPLTLEDGTPLAPAVASAAQNNAIGKMLEALIGFIRTRLAGMTGSGEGADYSIHADMELEFATRYGEDLRGIRAIDIPVQPGTWIRLLDGLIRSESVPFEGDALEGLQVMGTLETRALDYKNIVILSCNEDLFPHRSTDNSFIPPELRKGFGMPTIEYQDSVWAYYFYRLLQRAENVWLVYDSRTEGLLSGEESRYIKQLEYHFRYPLERYTAVAAIAPPAGDETIEKTAEDIATLRNERHLSASSLQSYLGCPVKFYYQAVKGLRADDDVTESLDAAKLGTIFHACMQELYKDRETVTVDDIRTMLSDETSLRSLVSSSICEHGRTVIVEGRNIIIEEVVLEYIKAALRHDLHLLGQSGSEGFRVLGLEKYMSTVIDGFKFIGFVDRIDSYKPGEVRIVDYKTGKVEDEDILITDSNARGVTDKLFGEVNTGRPKIALQLYLYDQFAHDGLLRSGETVVNSIYSTARLLTSPLPDVPESPSFSELVRERLHDTLTEIADTSIPWKRTADKHLCSLCDFCSICGR